MNAHLIKIKTKLYIRKFDRWRVKYLFVKKIHKKWILVDLQKNYLLQWPWKIKPLDYILLNNQATDPVLVISSTIFLVIYFFLLKKSSFKNELEFYWNRLFLILVMISIFFYKYGYAIIFSIL